MAMDAAASRHGDVFAYRVVLGRAGRSYGLRVAALAGVSAFVLAKVTDILGDDMQN